MNFNQSETEHQLGTPSKLDSSAFVLGLPLLFGFIQLLILPWCYDSPAFLVSKDKEKSIKAAAFYQLVISESDEPSEHKEINSNPDPIRKPSIKYARKVH